MPARLGPTMHPPVPHDSSQFLLLPSVSAARHAESAAEDFARGLKFLLDGEYAAALSLVSSPALTSTPLADYAEYYKGLALLGLERFEAAEDTFDDLEDRDLTGYLAQAVPLREAEVAMLRNKPSEALAILEDLAREKITAPEDLLLRIARAAEEARQIDRALAVYRRLYFEFPLSAEAEIAEAEINRLDAPSLLTPDRFQLELGRAERLFGGKRYGPARDAFSRLAKLARGDDKELVGIRLAECDYYLKRYRASVDALRPYLDDSKREAEARFFHLTGLRALGNESTYVALARELIADFPTDSWAEEALQNLATHYVVDDDDAEADRVFRQLYEQFPNSPHSQRAAWKIGWSSYKSGRFAETARIFEEAAARFPRADLRPAWLYWSARAHDRAGNASEAVARYGLALTDYQNSYYGRRAAQRLAGRAAAAVTPMFTASADAAATVPTDTVIRELIRIGLYDDALQELQYAQRVWGPSPALQATTAWVHHQQGLTLDSWDRFNRIRGAINEMKRAYPHYIAAGGESLPPDVLRIVFPLDYWPLIEKYSKQHGLDPYLMTALVAQESTFTRDVRSPANAVGLMQLMAPTARAVARKLGIRYSAAALTQPETNIRLGMKYFDDMVEQFGGAHFALAGYNAGPHRVVRWRAEKPDLEEDEFIDDIPFPETQNYVKRILGTAEDYRRLYGGGVLKPVSTTSKAPAAAAKATAKKPAVKSAPKRPSRKPPSASAGAL